MVRGAAVHASVPLHGDCASGETGAPAAEVITWLAAWHGEGGSMCAGKADTTDDEDDADVKEADMDV